MQSCLAELSGVHKRFGATLALDGIDLQVRSGELFAALGPNGAGKSTAIALLLGLLRPDKGAVTLFGKSPHELEPRRHIGVMMQEVNLPSELRVREQIDLVASYYPAPMSAIEAMERTHTAEFADRLYSKLSGGQKRQVQFAMALCGRPKLLFLDEPTVGLDVQARERMWQSLRQLVAEGVSIVLTTHYLEEAEALADRVAVIGKGRVIASGSVSEIRSLVSRKHIHCRTSLTLEHIRTWEQVESAQQQGGRLHITTPHAEGVVRRLLEADANVEELEVRRAGLSEAFSELTQETAP